MATARLVHRRRLSDTHVRELDVYYDKGGMNYWDYSQKPKGIYFSASLYQDAEGSAFKTWTSGQKGDGYILVEPLDRYRPKALRDVRARVLARAEAIHALLDVGDADALARLKAILGGTETATSATPAVAA